jgi:hypothetical protein
MEQNNANILLTFSCLYSGNIIHILAQTIQLETSVVTPHGIICFPHQYAGTIAESKTAFTCHSSATYSK